MILVLNIKVKEQALWQLYQDDKLIASQLVAKFEQNDSFLASLDKLFEKTGKNLKLVKSFILLVKEASLTQLKLATAIINALAWLEAKPIAGEFFYHLTEAEVLSQQFVKISKIKEFTPLKVEYLRPVDITISKKVNKFKLTN